MISERNDFLQRVSILVSFWRSDASIRSTVDVVRSSLDHGRPAMLLPAANLFCLAVSRSRLPAFSVHYQYYSKVLESINVTEKLTCVLVDCGAHLLVDNAMEDSRIAAEGFLTSF